MVKDATADYSEEMMHAALDVNLPNDATAIMTTQEMVQSLLRSHLRKSERSSDSKDPSVYLSEALREPTVRAVVERSDLKKKNP